LDALKAADIPALARAACHEAHTGYPVPRYLTQTGCEDLIKLMLPPTAKASAAKEAVAAPAKAPRTATRKSGTQAKATDSAPSATGSTAKKTAARKPRTPKAPA
ncbi:MAG: hypothetical protein K2W33_07660, partial [Burkholderiales bacterium]|nr:hypothetical protein [Burkholderiales bacterium]